MIEAIVQTSYLPSGDTEASRRRFSRRESRGFTMIEAVVVVAILGLIIALGSQQIMKALQRTALEKAQADLRLLFQRAQTEMQRRGVVTFIRIGPKAGTTVRIKLIADTNGNGQMDDPVDGGTDTIVDSIDILVSGNDRKIALSSVDKDQIEADRWLYDSTSVTPDWSDYTKTDIAKDRVLMCDFRGRAARPDSGAQLDRSATLRITHVNILGGTLRPRVRYELHITPVWNVDVARQIQDGTGTWVTSAGQI